MRAFMISIAAAIVIAAVAILPAHNVAGDSGASIQLQDKVRFPHIEAGHNLGGTDWSSVKQH
ncbi:hypothetical protein ABIF33_003450 [Bradyrhizobium elkanii]|uniref:hypothetical protein n=1 Tax=Bradyrhizobium elkanii TaxID=29448 RepID=UPI0035196799